MLFSFTLCLFFFSTKYSAHSIIFDLFVGSFYKELQYNPALWTIKTEFVASVFLMFHCYVVRKNQILIRLSSILMCLIIVYFFPYTIYHLIGYSIHYLKQLKIKRVTTLLLLIFSIYFMGYNSKSFIYFSLENLFLTYHIYTGIGCVLFILIFTNFSKNINFQLRNSVLRTITESYYSLYIMHIPIIFFLYELKLSIFNSSLGIILTYLLIFIISMINHYFFENKLYRLSRNALNSLLFKSTA